MLWLGSKGTSASIRWVARLGALSLLATIILSSFDYSASFYLLHTRFWELAVGVVLAQMELRMRSPGGSPSDVPRASWDNVREVVVFCAATAFVCIVALGSIEHRWERDTVFRDSGLALILITAGIAVLCVSRSELQRRFVRNVTHFATASSILGIILICASAIGLSSNDWPSAQTFIPVIGTALVIAATPETRLNKILGGQSLVSIGGISYPLYLWHWPLIVFWTLLNPAAPEFEMAVPLAISFGLAYLTKILIEDPVRFGNLGHAMIPRPSQHAVVAGLVFAAALGSIAVATEGLPSRLAPGLQAIATWSQKERNPALEWRFGRCYQMPKSLLKFPNECTPAKRAGVPLVLLWGDSHAAHLYPGLTSLQSGHTFDVAQWTTAGCPPTTRRIIDETAACPTRRATALHDMLELNPDVVLLAGAWELYMQKGESETDIVRAEAETIRQLNTDGDKKIIVFGPGPTWNTSLAGDLFRFMAARRLNEIPERYGHAFDAAWHLDAAMAKQASALGAGYISVLNHFCNRSGCRTVGNRSAPKPDLLFFDSNHLTISGSKDLMTDSELHLF
jgi:peptidoglycan/LPS O-acetylase OafA/YrhL